ncbi:MAG: HEPN domain-containing protein [Bacteroidetes bacterium]|nr:HEPN domain-containing protein [Bacteroidota bacterium]
MKKSKEEIELISDWIAIARENLLSARSLFQEEYAPYRTVCFLCQGSGEKYLKAYLIWNGWELEKNS